MTFCPSDRDIEVGAARTNIACILYPDVSSKSCNFSYSQNQESCLRGGGLQFWAVEPVVAEPPADGARFLLPLGRLGDAPPPLGVCLQPLHGPRDLPGRIRD